MKNRTKCTNFSHYTVSAISPNLTPPQSKIRLCNYRALHIFFWIIIVQLLLLFIVFSFCLVVKCCVCRMNALNWRKFRNCNDLKNIHGITNRKNLWFSFSFPREVILSKNIQLTYNEGNFLHHIFW